MLFFEKEKGEQNTKRVNEDKRMECFDRLLIRMYMFYNKIS